MMKGKRISQQGLKDQGWEELTSAKDEENGRIKVFKKGDKELIWNEQTEIVICKYRVCNPNLASNL